jgi:acetylglutamate kinase
LHGGGKAINQKMEQAGSCRRWSWAGATPDERVLAIAEQVLCNEINRFIVNFIQARDAEAMGPALAQQQRAVRGEDLPARAKAGGGSISVCRRGGRV